MIIILVTITILKETITTKQQKWKAIMAEMVNKIFTTKNRFMWYKKTDGYLIMRRPVDNNNAIRQIIY